MKKSMQSIISGVLAFALTAGLLSGITPCAKAEAETLATLEPPTVTNFETQVTPAQGSVSLQGVSTDTVMPVHAPQTGVVEIAVAGTSLTSSVEMGFFSDAACQTSAGNTATISGNSSQVVTQSYQVSGEGTYYLRFHSQTVATATSAALQVQALAYSGKELNLNETSQAVYTADTSKKLYHKLTVKKSGVVVISGNSYQESGSSLLASSLSLELCDKKKKSLRSATLSSSNSYQEAFALKKGTYYVAVSCGDRYQLSAKTTTWTDQSGTKKSKAKLIRKKASAKGMIAMTDSRKKTDWFKIKVPKRSKIQLNVAAVCTGTSSDIRVEIIPANKHYTLLNASVLLGNSGRKMKSRTKLNAGTYYIKVTKVSQSASGVYTITYAK
jgi:hypothetical protein